jgi:hypothetical protein
MLISNEEEMANKSIILSITRANISTANNDYIRYNSGKDWTNEYTAKIKKERKKERKKEMNKLSTQLQEIRSVKIERNIIFGDYHLWVTNSHLASVLKRSLLQPE